MEGALHVRRRASAFVPQLRGGLRQRIHFNESRGLISSRHLRLRCRGLRRGHEPAHAVLIQLGRGSRLREGGAQLIEQAVRRDPRLQQVAEVVGSPPLRALALQGESTQHDQSILGAGESHIEQAYALRLPGQRAPLLIPVAGGFAGAEQRVAHTPLMPEERGLR